MRSDPLLGTLSGGGVLAALMVGIAVFLGTGVWGVAVLFTFFLGSTWISRWAPDPAAEQGEAKGGRRDAGQVLANGGVPALGALLGLVEPSVGIWVFSIGIAAAAADTWATAVGATSPSAPRNILTWRPVSAGTSGGITLRGTFGGVVGAVSVGSVAALASRDARLFTACVAVGTLGMLLDSLLGATLQGRFHCPTCDVETERPTHQCGATTRPVGGIRWLTNDGVNAIATSLATGIGWWIVASMS